MELSINCFDFVSQIVPQKMRGTKLTYKVRIKDWYTKANGTNSLYIDINLDVRKKLFINIDVPAKFFDKKKQRIKKAFKYSDDYNLLIEKVLSDINDIEVNYRLNNSTLNMKRLLEELLNPSLRINFNTFAKKLLEKQFKDGLIKKTTYRQQQGCLAKIKKFKNPLLFSDINDAFVSKFKTYLKHTLENKNATIAGTLKNFKKYLHAANSAGIKTDIKFDEIKIGSMKGQVTFLLPEEVKKLYFFYNSPYINKSWKYILQRYLFSCFTGIRISDIERISEDNFIDATLVFSSNKTDKLQRIKLNETALSLVTFPEIFKGNYTREHINRELKEIAKACGINKRLYFHSSRHTFATNYLMKGGKILNLQKLLGHSKIESTMVYSHAVDSITDKEIENMDDIIK